MEPIDRVFIMKALTSSEGQAAIKAMTGPDAYAYFLDLVCSAPTIDPIRAAGGCRCGECRFGRKPHAEDMQDGYVYCQEQSKYMSADDFCSGGDPREARDDG